MNFVKKFLKKKSVIALLVIGVAVGGYYIYKNATKVPMTTRYVTAAAAKGTISVSVSGTGQVASTNQVDVKPGVSGTITSLSAVVGQKVKSGQLLATIDNRAATRAVSDAQTSLETAQLNLQKALEPADSLTVMQQENSLLSAKNSKTEAEASLIKAYDDGFSSVSSSFLDMPAIMTGLQNILTDNNANESQSNMDFYADAAKGFDPLASSYRDDAYSSYQKARTAYDKNFNDYKIANRSTNQDTTTALLTETYDTAQNIAEAVKDANNLIQFYKDKLTEHGLVPIALADTQISTLGGYTNKANNIISTLYTSRHTIDTTIKSISDYDRTIAEKQASLEKTKAGTDALDIRSLQISIDQKKNALADANDKLSDYYIRAPFAGIIAAADAKKGDTASSGTVIATLLADQQVADVSLNEIDAAKIKVGQKATLAFDAIEDLIITGEVSSIDLIGTVSQGVVSYNVKIVFDTQDERIKSGMSVTAAIIINTQVDVLTVPNASVKTQGTESFVQVLTNGQPTKKTVTTGLANDTDTEITSGLIEGDEVVTQSITTGGTATTTTTKSATSAIPGLGGSTRAPGAGGFGGR